MNPAQMPLGEIRLESLRRNPATDWFAMGYDLFSFDDAESYRKILSAQPRFDQLEVLAFIGAWCPDCQDHLPGFARILDAVKFPASRFRVFALDRSKTYPGGANLVSAHSVTRLPTFVFLKGGKEIGRITETPRQTLLKDMAALFSRS